MPARQSSPHSQQAVPHQADVLLVTATQIEALAVLGLAGEASGQAHQRRHIGDKTFYDLGSIADTRVWMVQSGMGTTGPGGALLTVQKGIAALDPAALIMVGVAFGVDPERQRIGDVLVSRQIVLYEQQRLGTREDALDIRVRGDRPSASSRLLDRFESAALERALGLQTPERPAVHFGLLFSGEKLIDHRAWRDALLALEPEAVGGEMEGGGLYTAASDRKVDWIIAKAICDWADGGKHIDKHNNQTLAAHNAARLVLEVLQHGGLGRPAEALAEPTSTPASAPGGLQFHNYTSNQGAQGLFQGPVTVNTHNKSQ
ncbi:MAG TPA: hypothetical protein VFS21_34815 [Roseiflexaceae bacterium]|nr:hypothetical protein [Roseiflexaceae bacterium]